jgi:hypothetical protein
MTSFTYSFVKNCYHRLAQIIVDESKPKMTLQHAITLTHRALPVTPILDLMKAMKQFEKHDRNFYENNYFHYFIQRLESYFMIPQKMMYEKMCTNMCLRFTHQIIRKDNYERGVENE